MAKNRTSFNSAEGLFSNPQHIETPAETSRQGHTEIRIENLIPFSGQPFRPYTEEKLVELAEDIKSNGILSPIIVRPFGADKYQILAGHNRTNAAKLAGLETVPCIIKHVDDDTAKLIMLNTNLNQRDELLPSEKAFAYKMQLEAIERRGATNGRTSAELEASAKENKRQIQRYIRLTYLIPQLLGLVDEKTLPFRAAVNVSYLNQDEQNLLASFLQENELSVTLEQSEKLKALSSYSNPLNKLDASCLEALFGKKSSKEKAPPTYTSYKLPNTINRYFEGLSKKQIQDRIASILEEYFSE